MEQELEIRQNGEFKNLDLKPKPMKGIKGLDFDNFVIVEKVFAEGLEVASKHAGWAPSYSCKAKYKDEEVSFWLTKVEHEIYKATGGAGDKVKLTLVKEPVVNPKTNLETLIPRIKTELVA